MSRICGIELKSSEAILVVIDTEGDTTPINIDPRRIRLGDDESADAVRSFFESFCDFVRDQLIDVIAIKKRAKKGKMAGGAVSFKLEALIQLQALAKVEFVSPQAIAAAAKREPFDVPEAILAYQEQAFLAASLYLRRSSPVSD